MLNKQSTATNSGTSGVEGREARPYAAPTLHRAVRLSLITATAPLISGIPIT
jgi:hypothetical protein